MILRHGNAFGDGLKAWRVKRSLSQLDLALEANVSARHISYLETGRAKPSREMVLQLAETLQLPLRARNDLLDQAGFARVFPETRLGADALDAVRRAMAHVLAGHMPFPALIFDRHWTLLEANATARALLAPLDLPAYGMNIIRAVAENPAARAAIANWSKVMADMRARLRLEAARSGPDDALGRLLTTVQAALGSAADMAADPVPMEQPFIPVLLDTPAGRLSMLSVLAEFGTPRDITVGDVRIELFFPADAATDAALRALATAQGSSTQPSPGV